jgi:hypothetical protein
VFSKILEKPIYNRLIIFINKHNLLTDAQHGFKDNTSTETTSKIFTASIQESMDKLLYVLGSFFGLTKAYDVIYHDILLNNLECYVIRGTIKAWTESYLSYRLQFLEIFQTDNTRRNQKIYKSSCKEIKHQVPQGSVLGLLLFLLYINDLPLNIQNAKLVLFADNINIIITDKSIDAVQIWLNRVIRQFGTWFSNNSFYH